MEQFTVSELDPPSGPVDKSNVLVVKPLKCLVPLFPSAGGMSQIRSPQPSPFVCVPPSGPFPPGVSPFYPFFEHNSGGRAPENEITVKSKRTTRRVAANGDNELQNQNQNQNPSDSGIPVNDNEDANTGGRKGKAQKRVRRLIEMDEKSLEAYFEPLLNHLLESFNLTDLDTYKKNDGDRETVWRILLTYNLLRRKMFQLDEKRETTTGNRRSDLKSGTMMMTKGIRTNATKRIGNVPGVETGDIFFFRMELCLVGVHAQSMGGIDYMSVKLSQFEEPLALSIVSSGGYNDDEGDDPDVLIYTGQGGVQRRDKQMFDQKLEKGNLALEKSLHRGNEVRVIRGLKDNMSPGCKVYVYDGLYRIQESWTEKNKDGWSVFKYKLVRFPGQPEAYTLWKSIQQWKDGAAPRNGVILSDLTAGQESQPVCVVNNVDNDENGPSHFTYTKTLKDPNPVLTTKPALTCRCARTGCEPGSCPCLEENGGFMHYSPLGVLLTYKDLITECGPSCSCPPTCRNRISQTGLRARFEVFKTMNRGWGLRSWDPIRSGSFICEYAGEVVGPEYSGETGDPFIFDATRFGQDQSPKIPFDLVISSRSYGNVARFMNHSCSPNVMWQPVVRRNNDEEYYHIALFAIFHIPPLQELTFDYGLVPPGRAEERRRKRCLCGSRNCRGVFY